MKKIFCFFVMFLISNGVNAADKWEYVSFINGVNIPKKEIQFVLVYPDGKKDVWYNIERDERITPPIHFFDFVAPRCDKVDFAMMEDAFKKDFSQHINVITVLGICGFEMSGYTLTESREVLVETFWFKRKISK